MATPPSPAQNYYLTPREVTAYDRGNTVEIQHIERDASKFVERTRRGIRACTPDGERVLFMITDSGDFFERSIDTGPNGRNEWRGAISFERAPHRFLPEIRPADVAGILLHGHAPGRKDGDSAPVNAQKGGAYAIRSELGRVYFLTLPMETSDDWTIHGTIRREEIADVRAMAEAWFTKDTTPPSTTPYVSDDVAEQVKELAREAREGEIIQAREAETIQGNNIQDGRRVRRFLETLQDKIETMRPHARGEGRAALDRFQNKLSKAAVALEAAVRRHV